MGNKNETITIPKSLDELDEAGLKALLCTHLAIYAVENGIERTEKLNDAAFEFMMMMTHGRSIEQLRELAKEALADHAERSNNNERTDMDQNIGYSRDDDVEGTFEFEVVTREGHTERVRAHDEQNAALQAVKLFVEAEVPKKDLTEIAPEMAAPGYEFLVIRVDDLPSDGKYLAHRFLGFRDEKGELFRDAFSDKPGPWDMVTHVDDHICTRVNE
jgi:hypothetical protein